MFREIWTPKETTSITIGQFQGKFLFKDKVFQKKKAVRNIYSIRFTFFFFRLKPLSSAEVSLLKTRFQ